VSKAPPSYRFSMPRRSRSAIASAHNGAMSGEGRMTKKQRTDENGLGIAADEDKEVSECAFLFHVLKALPILKL
jgi:hypothetical protein